MKTSTKLSDKRFQQSLNYGRTAEYQAAIMLSSLISPAPNKPVTKGVACPVLKVNAAGRKEEVVNITSDLLRGVGNADSIVIMLGGGAGIYAPASNVRAYIEGHEGTQQRPAHIAWELGRRAGRVEPDQTSLAEVPNDISMPEGYFKDYDFAMRIKENTNTLRANNMLCIHKAPQKDLRVEVKMDARFLETGNIYLETACETLATRERQPSALATTKADLIVYGFGRSTGLFFNAQRIAWLDMRMDARTVKTNNPKGEINSYGKVINGHAFVETMRMTDTRQAHICYGIASNGWCDC